MPESTEPLISVAICTYDRHALMVRAIESCFAQSLPADQFEIIVVDNSPDLQAAELHQHKYDNAENVKYVIERTPGLSNARNVATSIARAPFIAFLDDDAVASRDWLKEILVAFNVAAPVPVGIVGGRIDPEWEIPRPVWLDDSMLGLVSVIDWGGDVPRLAGPNEWFAGANISFRVGALKEAGQFNTSLGRLGNASSLLSNEEVQVSQKIEAAGYARVYAPRARVDHLVPRSRLTQAFFRRRVAWQATSDVLMRGKGDWHGQRAWDSFAEFIATLPGRDRSMRGLLVDLEDPKHLKKQMDAIYTFTLLALTGFEGVDQ